MSHDECIKLTNCEGIFEDDSGAEDVEMEGGEGDSDEEGDTAMDEDDESADEAPAADKADWGSDSDDEPAPQPSKKTRKNQHKVGKERVNDTEEGFFDGL